MLKLPGGTITLSRDELKQVLFGVRGAKPVTITARTVPKLKGGMKNRLNGLEKLSRVNGIINFSYENAVNKQRQREDNDEKFEAEPRKWGVRLFDNERHMLPLVAKEPELSSPYVTFEDLKRIATDKLYLELKVQKSLEHEYYLNGVIVPNDEAELEVYKAPSSGRQAVEREVILRDYAFGGIEEVAMDGNVFVLGQTIGTSQFIKKGEQSAV